MKILTCIILAGAIAATSIAATATGAAAGNWNGNGGNWSNSGNWNDDWHGPYKHKPRGNYHQSSPDVGGALFAGALFGLAIGAIASQPDPYYVEPEPYYTEPEPEAIYLPPPHPAYTPPRASLVAADDHYAWCKTNYRSYNAERDTFVDFQGIERRCFTPYEQAQMGGFH